MEDVAPEYDVVVLGTGIDTPATLCFEETFRLITLLQV
jgi:hypothetical protein